MKFIKLTIISILFFTISCYSASYNELIFAEENNGSLKIPDKPQVETIKLYGMIKVESGYVYIVTNWTSRSMVTYSVTGFNKKELSDNAGKYAFVDCILIKKEAWSGIIDVKTILSIDIKPDPAKERRDNSRKKFKTK